MTDGSGPDVTPEYQRLNEEIIDCFRCPRLVAWREEVARTKRKSFQGDEYWGRPIPNFGDPTAKRLIVGLAPAAHGGNRTGRIFTGDRSGDWLFRALHKAGVANQPTSVHAADGLELTGVLITAIAHCAPPDNKPLPDEIKNCSGFFHRILESRDWQGILCLGNLAWVQLHRALGARAPKFHHGVQNGHIFGSFHPSQQNTFTGKLTEPMLDDVVMRWLEYPGR